MRRFPLIMALIMLLALAAPSASAQARQRCFAETGYCVSGPILAYWERNGGLPIFGYPISPLAVEDVYNPENPSDSWRGPVQWFERDRLEDHSNEGLGVLAGRLGAQQLYSLTVGLIVPRPEPVDEAPAQCRNFAITRHNICGAFRTYWERNGGLERFGYPLSEPFELTSGNWSGTVQYFERRRLELHDELSGSPVMLGLLGKEIRNGEPSASCPIPSSPDLQRWLTTVPFHQQMGCPTDTRDTAAAEQYFQYGVMLWVAPASEGQPGQIYVIGSGLPITYRVFADTWREGEPEPNETAPAGLRVPQRGFGKIWRENPDIRAMLGWARDPERADQALFQGYTRGAVVWLRTTDYVYAFGPSQIAQAKPRNWGA